MQVRGEEGASMKILGDQSPERGREGGRLGLPHVCMQNGSSLEDISNATQRDDGVA